MGQRVNEKEINGFEIDVFNQHGLDVGKKPQICPICSPQRKSHNQKKKCASADWETGIATCHHGHHTFQLHTFKGGGNKEEIVPILQQRKQKPVEYSKPERNEFNLIDEHKEYFKSRGISEDTLKHFKVSTDSFYCFEDKKSVEGVALNYFKDGQIIRDKAIQPIKDTDDWLPGEDVKFKKKYLASTKDCNSSIPYNIDSILDKKTIAIVEGEIDALSFHEAGFKPIISLPNGAKIDTDFIDDQFKYFSAAEKVYIYFDNDDPGQVAKEAFVDKFLDLGMEVMEMKHDDFNDANEVLQALGKDGLVEVMKKAVPITEKYQKEDEPELTPLERLLLRRTTSDTPMDPDTTILWVDNIPFLSKGDASFITGQAGTGKSFLTTLLVSVLKGMENDKFKSDLKEDEIVAWFDTEQKKNDVIKIAKRISALSGNDGDIEIYRQREVSKATERLEEFQAYMQHFKPGVVVIDGLTDYLNDPNDLKESSQLISDILKLSTECNSCVICVVHQNESGGMKSSKKMRGHAGSEGTRKAENVIGIELGNGQFNVKRLKSRNAPWKDWSFKIVNDGPVALPVILGDDERKLTSTDATEKIFSKLMLDRDEAIDTFQEIITKLKEGDSSTKVGKTKFIKGISDWSKSQTVDEVKAYFGEGKATQIYDFWLENGVIDDSEYGNTLINSGNRLPFNEANMTSTSGKIEPKYENVVDLPF